MSKFAKIIGSAILFVLSGGLVAAKRIADWVGRSTFVEDAEALGPKAAKMFEWLADQPAFTFYAIPLILAAVAVMVLFIPTRSISRRPNQPTPLLSEVSLRLLMRQNQDPQELSKQNVWRWFIFKNLGKDANGNIIPLGTYIFLVFDNPAPTNYRRVASPSHPSVRFNVIEITERSMVVVADNVDLDSMGAILEIRVSDKPI